MHNLDFPNPSHIIQGFQSDKQEIQTIREQSKIVYLLQQKVNKRDVQIQELQKAVIMYKKKYADYQQIKASLCSQNSELQRLKQQNKILYTQVDKAVKQTKEYQEKLLKAEKQKHDFIKQRNNSDKRFRDIQQTFQQYQQSCKSRQKELLIDLEKAYKQIKELNTKIDNLERVQIQNEELKNKLNGNSNQNQYTNFYTSKNSPEYINMSLQYPINSNQNSRTYGSQSYQFSGHRSHHKSNEKQIDTDNFSLQIQNLKKQIYAKEEQLQRAKALTHQLSIEFDKSVSKICQFEKQLTAYRKQNHELKKTLSLFVEREQYQKMHKNKISHNESSQQSIDYDQSENNIGYSQFTSSERAF